VGGKYQMRPPSAVSADENLSVWRNVLLLAAIVSLLVGGTWLIVKTATDRLLYQNATKTAEMWAQYVAGNALDLEQIAAGENPSSASMAFFQATRKSGEVYRYTIFNRYGYSILVSDRDRIIPVDLSTYSADAARAVAESQPVVRINVGRGADEPTYSAEAYVPVLAHGQTVAVVAADVDQSAERNSYYRVFVPAAAALCLLTSLSFGLPALAWYRRTKEKQQADRRIRYLAHHDALTGLVNRRQLIEELNAALSRLAAAGGMIAVHFIDIDHFKNVNDTLGHDGGDSLLSSIGERLRRLARIEDTVARLGGDEFVVVQTAVGDKAQVETFARRISSALAAPVSFKEQEIRATYTIGIALAPTDGTASESLLKRADLALYSGKAAGRDCIRFFSPEMDEQLQKRIAIEKIIRDAVAHEGFSLHYQPIFEIKNGKLIGFEALARLPAPDHTLIPPATFMPIIEEMHLIDKVGAWVLNEACRTATNWPAEMIVAVNLSPTQFESGDIEAVVAEALRSSGLDPKRLELEVTETLVLRDADATLAKLRRLKAMGVSIAMDDFGTGYSSLSYLWKFPFDKIKIDRSFMEGFGKSRHDVETVIRSLVALGREMNMRVTVEGVETGEQVEFLYNADADQVQGFYFGKPMPATLIGSQLLDQFRKSYPADAHNDAKLRVIK
jgi:diguanylate cyclase (GGDEF)-like protein